MKKEKIKNISKDSKNPYRYLLKKMWYYAPSKRLVVWMFLFSIISKILWLIEPWILGNIINLVQIEWYDARNKIVWRLVSFASITFVFWLFHGISRVWEEKIKFDVAERYMADMFHKVSSLPMQWHTDNHSGETIDKINKGMYAIREFTGSNFMYLNTFMFSLGSLVSLALIRPTSSGIIFVVAMIVWIIIWKFDVYLIGLIKRRNKKEHLVMSTLFDFLSNIKTVITLRFENRALSTLREKVKDVFPVFLRFSVVNEWKWFTMEALLALAVVGILWLYLQEQFTLGGVILIGNLTMLIQYIEKMQKAFQNFTRQYSWIVKKKTDMEAVNNIEKMYHEIEERKKCLLPKNWKHIALQNLFFRYEDKEHKSHVLHDISLDISSGKKIALVGESGSGKSTLLALLRWLYDVEEVILNVDGEIYSDLHILASSTSLIPQEPEIFENTIRYNLTMWLDIEDEVLWDYLKMACADEVVHDLDKGLDTDIKERGVNLSGGQKQRLALARGLLMSRESSIILLDEPTSSVDSINEIRIHERVFDYFDETCIVAAIHKLHLLDKFDEIYVLDKGKLVEWGTYQDLLGKKGLLVEMLDTYEIRE